MLTFVTWHVFYHIFLIRPGFPRFKTTIHIHIDVCTYKKLLQNTLEWNRSRGNVTTASTWARMKSLADWPKSVYLVWHCQALREFSWFTSGAYRSFCFVCLYFTNQPEAQICPHPCHTQSLLEFKLQQDFLSTTLCLSSSPSSSRHNLFWAAAISCSLYRYGVTMAPPSMVSRVSAHLPSLCTSLLSYPHSSSAKQSLVVGLSFIYGS